MRYPPEHKQETRARIVDSARRLFNRHGFAEVTIDQIMEHAGLTHGGFYRHFRSKAQLYAHAVRHFLCLDEPEPWQTRYVLPGASGTVLARMIVDAYLSEEHLRDREGSCPLVSLSSDTARSGRAVKAASREVLDKMLKVFAAALTGQRAREQAHVVVALCVGAMVIARTVDDARLGDRFREAALDQVVAISGWTTT